MGASRNSEILTFWRWFFRDENGRKAGFKKLATRWIFLDLFVGVLLAFGVEKSIEVVAGAVLFPLAGIFIGISLTWSGAAQALLDSDELREMGSYHSGGYAEYPYSFQSAVLVTFITMSAWGLACVGLLEKEVLLKAKYFYLSLSTLLYGMISASLRICWGIIGFSHELLLAKEQIIRIKGALGNKTD